jgi:CRP-like cAMP-binding protein
MGDVATLRILGVDEIFGEQALIASDARRGATALAIDAVETHLIHREQFDELRRTHPEIDRYLVEVLVLQIRRLSTHLQEALFVASDKRVLRRLVDLCDFFGSEDGGAVIPMTQTDIASMAGASRSTANRVFKVAEEAGLLALRRGRVQVLDCAALAREAR